MEGASLEPTVIPLDLLRKITNDFSEERKLGSGSFGQVYLGVYPDGEEIAVKKLYDMPGLDEKQFLNEFRNLTRLQHQNIVRLVGYCHNIQEEYVMHQGKLVIAEKTHRALCLEYMSKGSLSNYLSDECDRYDWCTCYRIIRGICQGLKYLHDELIYHFDLKPGNVLLDENMDPRIADFGTARLFINEQTQCTQSLLGTTGYLPPEYILNNLISNKFDIFSLGVVLIKMMAGRLGYTKSFEMPSQEFTNLVQENWTNRLLETPNRRNAYSEQVKICIEIGLSCVQEDRHKRPTIQDIVYRLEETETKCTDAARKDWLSIFQQANTNTPPRYDQDPNDRQTEQIYHGYTCHQSIVHPTHFTCFEQNPGPRLDDELELYMNILERDSGGGRKPLRSGSVSRQETLEIDDPSVLTTSFCDRLTSLRCLKLVRLLLTEEQGRALLFLKYLQELEFECCYNLEDLPAGLHLLPSLKRLKIDRCRRISRLPETGLPLSLEELELEFCINELADQCMLLATSKLNVKIVDCF